ncbi:hypothetical protein PWP89_09685 [Stenotrophomonas rhizophila]|uniref:hypothetical protein n=1 Tax=Stenotrophomonas rhizophila TaxID=216778 RepID=UPI00117E5C49|nr:hypothetical protein [Stenotrophomonas rhizophila]
MSTSDVKATIASLHARPCILLRHRVHPDQIRVGADSSPEVCEITEFDQVAEHRRLALALLRPRPLEDQRAEARYAVRMTEAWEIAYGTRKNGRRGMHLRAAIDSQLKAAKEFRKRMARIMLERAEQMEAGGWIRANWLTDENEEGCESFSPAMVGVLPFIELPSFPTPLPMGRPPANQYKDLDFNYLPNGTQVKLGALKALPENKAEAASLEPTQAELDCIFAEVRYWMKGEKIAETEAVRKKLRVRKQTAARVRRHAEKKKAAASGAPER